MKTEHYDFKAIQIETGEPSEKEAASRSLFVFPFAYHPHKILKPDTKVAVYRDIAEAKKAQHSYFTTETANSLYGRTLWLELDDQSWKKRGFDFVMGDGRKVRGVVAPPQLVLFEWARHSALAANARAPKPRSVQGECDPLSTALLILDVHFEPIKDDVVTLDDVLEINDLFRCFKCPWPQQMVDFSRLMQNWPIRLSQPSGDTIRDLLEKQFRAELIAERKTKGNIELFQYLKDLFKAGKAEVIVARDKLAIDKLKSLQCQAYLDRFLSLASLPVEFEGNYFRIISEEECNQSRRLIDQPDLKAKPGCLIYSDHRAYVWTSVLFGKGVETLAESFPHEASPDRPWIDRKPEEFGHWVKLLNVDSAGGSSTKTHLQVSPFEREWTRERTYDRWHHYRTWYGFTYHSGVQLAEANPQIPIWVHFRTHYLDLALLLLYLRVSIFRLSNELFAGSQEGRASDDPLDRRRIVKRFNRLSWTFTLFTNLYQFPLISNQQQAIEMYTMMRKFMDVREIFEEVEKEVHGTREYLSQWQQEQHSTAAHRLQSVAFVGLVFATAFGFFGINLLGTWFDVNGDQWRHVVMLFAGVAVAIGIFLLTLRWAAPGGFIDRLCREYRRIKRDFSGGLDE